MFKQFVLQWYQQSLTKDRRTTVFEGEMSEMIMILTEKNNFIF